MSASKIKNIDNFIIRFGRSVSWINFILIVVIILQVVLRYGFGKGLVVLEELQWHLYAAGVMIGLSYSQSADSHIRVDVFHMRFSRNSKNFWEIFGIVFFLIPFILVVFFNSLPFVAEAWRLNEMSDAPTGLPWRWLIKSVIPVSMLLLLASALSRLLRELASFFGLNED